jgi:hypothetical protein
LAFTRPQNEALSFNRVVWALRRNFAAVAI